MTADELFKKAEYRSPYVDDMLYKGFYDIEFIEDGDEKLLVIDIPDGDAIELSVELPAIYQKIKELGWLDDEC